MLEENWGLFKMKGKKEMKGNYDL